MTPRMLVVDERLGGVGKMQTSPCHEEGGSCTRGGITVKRGEEGVYMRFGGRVHNISQREKNSSLIEKKIPPSPKKRSNK
jgi:hypothetical protein